VSSLLARADSELLSLSPPAPAYTEAEAADREAFQLKKRFSFTQLAAFRKCPLQYKFAHVYKIPILGSFQKSFGQSIHLVLHAILALHLERGKAQQGDLFVAPVPVGARHAVPLRERTVGFRVTLDEALKIFEERWIDEWYESRRQHDDFKKEGREAVKRMHEAWFATPPNVAFLEQPFEWHMGERSLKGAVDRIDHLSYGGYAIYDYKTGRGKESDDLETSDKEQLWIYQIAMEERGLSIKKLAYVYVLTGQVAEVGILQGEQREAFQLDIKQRMEDILISRFSPAPSPFICRYCDFRNVCEFRRL
jgi:CRISPR/Cas system-associated exonuclease Cas4 (RecB family)